MDCGDSVLLRQNLGALPVFFLISTLCHFHQGIFNSLVIHLLTLYYVIRAVMLKDFSRANKCPLAKYSPHLNSV